MVLIAAGFAVMDGAGDDRQLDSIMFSQGAQPQPTVHGNALCGFAAGCNRMMNFLLLCTQLFDLSVDRLAQLSYCCVRGLPCNTAGILDKFTS